MNVHFPRRLVFSQAFEGRLPYHAVTSPSGEFNLRHEHGTHPGHVLGPPRRTFSAERALVRGERNKFLQKPAGVPLVKARADTTGVDEVSTAIDTDKE